MIIADLSCSGEGCREIQWRRETWDFQEKIVIASKDSWVRNNCSMACQESSWRSSTICSWNTWKVSWKAEKWLFFAFSFPWCVRSFKDRWISSFSFFRSSFLFLLTFHNLYQVPETILLSKDIVRNQVPLLHLPHLLAKTLIHVGVIIIWAVQKPYQQT